MRIPHGAAVAAAALLCLTALAAAWPTDGRPTPPSDELQDEVHSIHRHRQALRQGFLRAHPGTVVDEQPGRKSVYGTAFAHGATPVEAAEAFRQSAMPMFGVEPEDMLPAAGHLAGADAVPLMFDRDRGTYKFTTVYYTQHRDGVPVFGSRMTVLARNEAGSPVVLAKAAVRDLGTLRVPAAVRDQPLDMAGRQTIARRYGAGAQIVSGEKVIWAGIEDEEVAPRVANKSIVIDSPNEWLIVTDAVTGEVLHEDFLVCFVDITGNASGLATDGIGADICEQEILQPLPYLMITAGADTTFTDVNGDYVLPHGGIAEIPVNATLNGLWFDVFEFFGNELAESVPVTPPGPADFVFNASNLVEEDRAQVNAYVEANRIRDFVLQYNPAYPTLDQGGFPVTVNRTDNFCPGNAWYSPTEVSINFCQSSLAASRTNTAWTSVIYHEYGHHLVNAGGSGQGAYGEGMGDVMSVLLLDDPNLGLGFFNECFNPLRNADNTCLYLTSGCSTCGGGIHDCGQLISGAVWSTRNELIVTEPVEYINILADLAINSILLHNGTSINPDITIDYLTLDDDNGSILDGTPHYNEIAAGFGVHDLDAPPLALIDITFPNGRPEFVAPAGGTTVRVEVADITGSAAEGRARFYVDSGSGFVEVPLTQISGDVYDAVFPTTTCGSPVKYYFTADTTTLFTVSQPTGAPTEAFEALSAVGIGAIYFGDDFESDQGWTVTNDAGLSDGAWERATPAGGGDRGDPAVDGDGSGQCYVTDNADDNSDVDGGTTTLTSPMLDASAAGSTLEYLRWYSNTEGSSPQADTLVVEVSDDNGASWEPLEVVGPTGPEVAGGWFFRRFDIASIPNIAPSSSKFRVRFAASDLGSGSVVEAAVDGVRIVELDCGGVPACVSDCSQPADGQVDVADLLAVLGEWGQVDTPCDVDSDGVGVDELLDVLADWGACP